MLSESLNGDREISEVYFRYKKLQRMQYSRQPVFFWNVIQNNMEQSQYLMKVWPSNKDAWLVFVSLRKPLRAIRQTTALLETIFLKWKPNWGSQLSRIESAIKTTKCIFSLHFTSYLDQLFDGEGQKNRRVILCIIFIFNPKLQRPYLRAICEYLWRPWLLNFGFPSISM